ncbi:glycosyltransferase [Chryseobacterium foetidum]|uniref:glycosyltransferase n=1 Tax=Chryseobacterium foetidum TaxID=2951057 RepID=UPI0021C5C6A4|nr:glycosyltransferase [Chryseobacterium foetidum]
MGKPTIFYFVHAHGNGHRATFNILYPELSLYFKVVAVTTNKEISEYLNSHFEMDILELPAKYPEHYDIPEHTFSKAFEVTPYALEPAIRAKAFADAVLNYKPVALYCDGVPELAIMARSMGLSVVLVHLPGNVMNDPTQVFAHELADHIIAHFPSFLEQENYKYGSKTYYGGYLSKFSGISVKQIDSFDDDVVTILLGYENYDQKILQNITEDLNTKFIIIGNKREYKLGKNCRQLGFVKNINEAVAGNRVISAAGQNTVAELISLGKRIILLPESRPYDEQNVHANVLAQNGLAILAQDDFSAEQWRDLLMLAKTFKPAHNNFINQSSPREIAQQMKNWYA